MKPNGGPQAYAAALREARTPVPLNLAPGPEYADGKREEAMARLIRIEGDWPEHKELSLGAKFRRAALRVESGKVDRIIEKAERVGFGLLYRRRASRIVLAAILLPLVLGLLEGITGVDLGSRYLRVVGAAIGGGCSDD